MAKDPGERRQAVIATPRIYNLFSNLRSIMQKDLGEYFGRKGSVGCNRESKCLHILDVACLLLLE